MGNKRWDFRDVSSGLQKIREFLLGRKNIYHNRFPPLIAPRSIPVPDIPRGPEYRYSNQWYNRRSALGSVKPPVVAPLAEGRPKSAKKSYICPGMDKKSGGVCFPCPPTPGSAWWFDGHCYYESVKDVCRPPPPPPDPCKSPPKDPCPPTEPAETKTSPCATSPPCTPMKPKKKSPEDPCR